MVLVEAKESGGRRTKAMKKYLYIGLFGLLGLLLATLLHAVIEIPILAWMSDRLDAGQTNWLIEHWSSVHRMGGGVLWLGGATGGYLAGRKFWRILYIEKRYGTPRW